MRPRAKAKRNPVRPTKKIDRRSITSAENGEEGGRPRNKLPEESVRRLGPPPTEPLQLVRWHAAVLAEVSWLSMQGEIGSDLASSLRASAGTAARLLGPDVLAALDDKLDERSRGMKAQATGPALEEVPDGKPDLSIRRAPR